MAFEIWSVAQSVPLNSVQLKRLASMGLVVNFKTMQQPTILVTFFQIREYSQDDMHSVVIIIIVFNCQLAFKLDHQVL